MVLPEFAKVAKAVVNEMLDLKPACAAWTTPVAIAVALLDRPKLRYKAAYFA
jgi:hypothetical protein